MNQQVIGNFAPDGGLQIGKIVQIENGDCEISWVASGNRKEIPEPKSDWSYDELKLLNAPWCLNINHSGVLPTQNYFPGIFQAQGPKNPVVPDLWEIR